nr:PREDICTED: sodium channel subunit beta-2-like [Latimeria chalumnae]|eukprot:XP_006012485.2 PREDICTED: sodium channel subunit beta-2-like [Latimeria chalumnae]
MAEWWNRHSGLYFWILLLLWCPPTDYTIQHTIVYGEAGGDALLPCNFQEDPKGHLNDLTITWEYSIIGEKNKVVHSYHELQDQQYQDVQFKGRTKLFHAELEKRNASLLLRSLTEADQGEYVCVVDLHRVHRYYILLNVTDAPENSTSIDFVKQGEYSLTGFLESFSIGTVVFVILLAAFIFRKKLRPLCIRGIRGVQRRIKKTTKENYTDDKRHKTKPSITEHSIAEKNMKTNQDILKGEVTCFLTVESES